MKFDSAFGFSTPVLILLLSFYLLSLPISSSADYSPGCYISDPGYPRTSAGVPYCACGQAWVRRASTGPSICSSTWTSTTGACYANSNPIFSQTSGSPTPNPRCLCPSGACCQSNGMYKVAGTSCRTETTCVYAASCSGSSRTCPAINYKPSSTKCASASGACENDSFCTGTSGTCPAKTKKSSTTLCSAASGPCQNPAYCTGTSVTCPTKTLKPSTTVCAASTGPCQTTSYCTGTAVTCPAQTLLPTSAKCASSRGPCELDSFCTGIATSCPPRPLLPVNTICDPSEETCFTDANCTGTSPYCSVISAKPFNTTCGINTNCSTPLENKCDSVGECHIAQCATCPNAGYQGADCSCPGDAPKTQSGTLNATCSDGVWYVEANITDSLIIAPNTVVVITGSASISNESFLQIGTGSNTTFTGCLNLNGSLVTQYKKKTGVLSEVHYDASCSEVSPRKETLNVQTPDKCESASTSTSNTPGLLSIIVSTRNTCKFNYLYAVVPVASAVGLVIVGVVVGRLVSVLIKAKIAADSKAKLAA